MKTTQHTPGPWVANDDGLVYSQAPRLGKHNVICAVSPANADLIAAAPDLLAALEQCLPILDAHRRAALGEGDLTARTARAAIAKAGGDK